jgi:hypothetical protein
MHDPKLNLFIIKVPPYVAHPCSPKSITSKCSVKLQSISTECHPNNENCKTKTHNLQTINNIKNRKKGMEVLRLPSSSMMVNHLVLRHFLPVKIHATLHPLSHIFIHPNLILVHIAKKTKRTSKSHYEISWL